MKINIAYLLEGAKAARGTVVVIDVFRAFSMEAYIISQGAKAVLPVGAADFAYSYKESHPEVILIGERKGVKMPGFAYGNSPTEIQGVDFAGKTVLHTTSAGTQGIANAVHADEILTGSLVNASAIASYIKKKQPEEVTLVAMGLLGSARTEEDDLCAEYIKSLILGEDYPIDEEIEKLKTTSGAKFFDPAQNEVFPRPDFDYCTSYNRFDFVLKVAKNEEGLDCIQVVA